MNRRWKNEDGTVSWVNPKWWKWVGRGSRVWLVLAAIALAVLVSPEKSGAGSWAFRQGPQRIFKEWREFEIGSGGAEMAWQCVEVCVPSSGGVTVCRTECYRIY